VTLLWYRDHLADCIAEPCKWQTIHWQCDKSIYYS